MRIIKERSDTYKQEWGMYIKKPCIINASQMEEDFEVHTAEGIMRGRVGDFLLQGVNGELYPCALEIFIETYAPAKRCGCEMPAIKLKGEKP